VATYLYCCLEAAARYGRSLSGEGCRELGFGIAELDLCRGAFLPEG